MWMVTIGGRSTEECPGPRALGTVLMDTGRRSTVFTSETEAYAAVGRTLIHNQTGRSSAVLAAEIDFRVVRVNLAVSVE